MEGEEWTSANTSSFPRLWALTEENLGRADIAIFFGDRQTGDKYGGLAYVGIACNTYGNWRKFSLNLWQNSAAITAGTVSHEIGHNLGMEDDHFKPHKDAGCNGTGIMSYGNHPMQWSKCSRADFEEHYLKYKDQWCMPEEKKACNNADG